MGSHPSWEFEYTDPLVVEAPVEYVLSEFDAWNEDRGTEWDRGAFPRSGTRLPAQGRH
jgi:hypothetical protein